MAVPFSAETKQLTGKPFRVANDAWAASVSADGSLVYATAVGEGTPDRRLVWVDAAGEVAVIPGEPMDPVWSPALSPDESQAVGVVRIDGGVDLWVQDLARGVGRRLTFTAESDLDVNAPAWSPDGRDVVFSRCENLVCSLFAIIADGSGAERRLFEGSQVDFSHDGLHLVYETFPLDANADVLFVPLGTPGSVDSAGEPTALLQTAEVEHEPVLSPDGKYLAFRVGSGDESNIFLTQFPSGHGRWQVSFDGGREPRWSPAGGKLFFIGDDDALYEVAVSTTPTVEVGRPRKRVERTDELSPGRGYDVARDGRLLMVQKVPDAGTDGELAIVVVHNWLQDAARK